MNYKIKHKISETYEQQLNRQGYTLGSKIKYINHLKDGLIVNWFNDILTDREFSNALGRLEKEIEKYVKPIEVESND